MDAGASSTGTGSEECAAGVRLVVLNLPEDEGEGLGFRLTRTLWDPYPWVREVLPGARAEVAGLKTGDCLLQADGRDLLGLPVGQVAGLIRGDGAGRGVSLLVWNCGVDPRDDPELLWSCGGGSRGERARRALSGVVKALSCCVCAATAAKPLVCARSHLYCEACWARLERCALCREQLPPKESPYARNLVAEQVFEAIATEYEIKDTLRRPKESSSAQVSPARSPNASPSTARKGHYQVSMMNRHKKIVQFSDKFGQNYASDPNIHRSVNQEFVRRLPSVSSNPTIASGNLSNGNTECNCQNSKMEKQLHVPKITVEDTRTTNVDSNSSNFGENSSSGNTEQRQNLKTEHASSLINAEVPKIKVEDTDTSCCQVIQHKLVARLRQACSLADLHHASQQCPWPVSQSLGNVNVDQCACKNHSHSMENLKVNCGVTYDAPSQPVFVLPPIYVLACDHNKPA